MRGRAMLYVDQYGGRVWARTVKELKDKVGPGVVRRIYRDTKQGVVHVGYSIGRLWFSAFTPYAKGVEL